MESLSSSISTLFSTTIEQQPYPMLSNNINTRCHCSMKKTPTQDNVLSYQKFVKFALDETNLSTKGLEEFSTLKAADGKTELKMCSFQAPKIRLLRSLFIESSDGMQVLDLAIFPEVEYDLPIFCANFFTTGPETKTSYYRDLNPLHDVMNETRYKEKYYKSLIPLGLKYTELLPWGGKLTSESLKFFSPMVIWTKFSPSHEKHDILFSAFKDYYKAWLSLMDQAKEETDISQIGLNREAQHRYLTWRAQKDPGYNLLKRLIGETLAKGVVNKFLFNGVKELGNKTFLDYFPEYEVEGGSINEKRSIVGKSFESRPWDARGVFVGDTFS
ncbi:phytochromobilin:ferredoxin oxidoreductase, chloroplast / phytochromobilin synthase (HY2) [Artemisia annua]|uniref:Phytochromobilin:ferredoxin oxidoreductase, chloroplast / phytochromobilin synthase (HY2) n=1 Tax=Artemisia annua TaxID=35608 RepID=A0A2U1MLI3_ARTAN|nr:phytochromobilin:ferredoxin oxidoreductase, chloroplast / phytochromobilin synthase (HY2) [Artemisia annua]